MGLPQLAIPAQQGGAHTQSRELAVLKAREKKNVINCKKITYSKVPVAGTADYSQGPVLSSKPERHLEAPTVVKQSAPKPSVTEKVSRHLLAPQLFPLPCH